jgi:hypothetical protein
MKVQDCLQKSPSLVPILSQMNLAHTLIFTNVSQVLVLYTGTECENDGCWETWKEVVCTISVFSGVTEDNHENTRMVNLPPG